jgi:hypothetical protein
VKTAGARAGLEARVDQLVLEFARQGYEDPPVVHKFGWDRCPGPRWPPWPAGAAVVRAELGPPADQPPCLLTHSLKEPDP